MELKKKVTTLIDQVRLYWNTPPEGRHMAFKEIAAYSGGGIGAYMIITMGTACLLATGNTLISSALGVDAMDMYIMYVIAVLANIPLTGIRANIIDNTRNKAGKYRPYIVTMAIPSAIICIAMVWFPYSWLESLFGDRVIFGESAGYVAKCALILLFNLILHFFYYFFYDGYENLIHVLSPNTQERADVASVKSIVYSFAPTVVNLITPLIAQHIFHTNSTDIRVYRLLYPILAVLGILLCIVVYKYTEEKIVQAKSHVVQIKFIDALRAVAGNKYFWIISLAGWISFLELAYANIMYWLYNYGGACTGTQYSLIYALYGNASLWGMLAAPFCIRKWGKKAVLVVTNMFNIVFILAILPFVQELNSSTIWMVLLCLWFNALMGSFAHILNPSIQADIRDYQQYKTGERIDGMFATVTSIGTIITLITSSVLPFIYEKGGITKENAAAVTSNPEILGRVLADGKTVGELLSEQLAKGQNNYANAYSALYDPDVLLNLLQVLVIVAGVGAFLNVVPYFWYDFNERKQKSVVRVLQVRMLFEDYGNGVLNDNRIVEAVEIVKNARETAVLTPKEVSKKDYKSIKDKAERKKAKKAYTEAIALNEEIEISKFVCRELDKFSSDTVKAQLEYSRKICSEGLDGMLNIDLAQAKAELKAAKALPKGNDDEKEYRTFMVNMARNKIRAHKTVAKYYKDTQLVQPDFSVVDGLFELEDELDSKLKALYIELSQARKEKDSARASEIKSEIKAFKEKKEDCRKQQKAEMDKHAQFNRAAKPYLDAKKLLTDEENYTHYEDILAKYEASKANIELARQQRLAQQEREQAEKEARIAKLKEEKKAAKRK
ncbi:MAG: MFS transporter [Clostridia bacterium]|nr:MFS transporter [Clostridia bacterium]